jgi:hypothetical protein
MFRNYRSVQDIPHQPRFSFNFLSFPPLSLIFSETSPLNPKKHIDANGDNFEDSGQVVSVLEASQTMMLEVEEC